MDLVTLAGDGTLSDLSEPDQRLSYCAGQVRAYDPDRYLCTLFAPATAREALFALYAFDHEIGRVRHVASETMPGLIRLQWWRDALDGIEAGRPTAHPVVEALAAAWPRLGAHRVRLEAAIDARERELEEAPIADRHDLERHLEATGSGIALAALGLLGVSGGKAEHAAHHVGVAFGLAVLLRHVARDAEDRRTLLPMAALGRRHVGRESVYRREPSAGLADVVAELVGLGRARLEEARRTRRAVPAAALAALLPGSLAGDAFRRLARAGHDPFAPAAHRRDPMAPARLLWRHALGRF